MLLLIRVLMFAIVAFWSLSSHSKVTEWVSFSIDDGHIKVPVKIAEIDTFAILDTGAQGNAINTAFLAEHELSFDRGGKVVIEGVFGMQRVETLEGIPLDFFDASFELDGTLPVPLGHHSTGLLIGASFFNQFIVQIDYPNSQMRLITRGTLDLGEFENIPARSQRGSGEPLVKVSVGEEKSFWALLDTGNGGGVIVERSHAESMGLIEKVTSASLLMGATSFAITESTRVAEFTFGPYTLENVLISFPAVGQSIAIEDQPEFSGTRIKSQRQQGILGYDVLKNFVITMDYKRGQVHIGLPDESWLDFD
jgi:hypothetical protein